MKSHIFFCFPFLDDMFFVCETTKNMEAHYVRHIKKAKGFTWKGFIKIMIQ
jgi:hypothetical protein